MGNERILRLGIIGVGGFAGRHHQTALELEGEGKCRVIAACDPSFEALEEAAAQWRFEARGISVFTAYLEMLDACRQDLDLVIIPTPTPLHAEMHRACVERGLAVYLEKPPTLDPDELEEMIRMDADAPRRTSVGFHLVADEDRRRVKQRLLSGEFGRLREVTYRGLAPRSTFYFQRAPWAARLSIDGRRVLDSCFGNAMAHYVHNAMLWSGTESLDSPAGLAHVRAEIYRAYEIEGADTFFVSALTDTDIRLRIGMTHACAGVTLQEERLICEKATLSYGVGKELHIDWQDGRSHTEPLSASGELLKRSHLGCYDYLIGRRDRPLTLLEDCRPFVHLNALAYVSAGRIFPVPEADREITTAKSPDGDRTFISIREIATAVSRFAEAGEFPSEAGVSWAKPAERIARPQDLGMLGELGF